MYNSYQSTSNSIKLNRNFLTVQALNINLYFSLLNLFCGLSIQNVHFQFTYLMYIFRSVRISQRILMIEASDQFIRRGFPFPVTKYEDLKSATCLKIKPRSQR